MALRLCLVPIIGSGSSPRDSRRPKYFGTPDVPENWGGTDYGFEPWMLVASDLSAASVTFLTAQGDAFLIPENLDAILTSGQVNTVQNQLESMNIPAEWVTTTLNWRFVIRVVLGLFRFMARFAAVYGNITGTNVRVFSGGVNLSRSFSSLSADVRSALITTADQLSLDRSGITGITTLRQILRSVGEQMAVVPLPIGDMVV